MRGHTSQTTMHCVTYLRQRFIVAPSLPLQQRVTTRTINVRSRLTGLRAHFFRVRSDLSFLLFSCQQQAITSYDKGSIARPTYNSLAHLRHNVKFVSSTDNTCTLNLSLIFLHCSGVQNQAIVAVNPLHEQFRAIYYILVAQYTV
jgi:hypothetical protein